MQIGWEEALSGQNVPVAFPIDMTAPGRFCEHDGVPEVQARMITFNQLRARNVMNLVVLVAGVGNPPASDSQS